MFRRRAARPDAPPERVTGERFTYVHEGTTLRGALEAAGRVRIHGTVLGDVRVEGVLEVAPGGVIEGQHVEALEVRVLGTVRASVTAVTRVEIWNGGVLEGDVATAVLDIEEGATFVGRSSMPSSRSVAALTDGAAAAVPAAPAADADPPAAPAPADAAPAHGRA
jgi:cytoskeletal protein CcmA (bactofilin family)